MLTNLKISGTVFLLIPFSNIKKAYLWISKYLAQFSLLISFFQILKKAYLQISKYLAQFFCSSSFQMLRKHTYESQNTWHSFLLIPFSNIKKKHTYESQDTWHSFFCSSPFQILKKAYLRILKYLAQFFFAHLLFQILKKHTYESQNTLFILIIIILKETIYIKTIIQIDNHKVKYIITARILKLL